ncbi:MAG: LON peptidase substrate-binding domain-containing protein [Planctomycetota bacterium]|nr:LON peptidase substrate-binding domain-containing protein [Planctomycetota bacterium]
MTDGPDVQFDPWAVPLFPLPNVVLFPRAVLPLHIFEERYKAMTADALAGDGVIAMALLRPGWEKCYYAAPAIEPVVCVGKILTHEKLPDGKYNFLLQGIARGRVLGEDRSRPYRVGHLELLVEADVMEIDLENERHRLSCMLSEGICSNHPVVKQFRQMLTSTMPTAEIADLLAFNFIDDVHVKQCLLAETDPRRRVERLIPILDELRPVLESAVRRKMKSADSMN